MPDAWESANGTNPSVADNNGDPDGDGLTNVQEFNAGSDPNDFYNGSNPELAIVSGDGQRIETAANAVMLTSYYFVANPRPTTTVTGRVLDNDRTPVRYATVRTRGQEGFTDGSGGFILRNVPVEASGASLTVEAAFARPSGRVDRAQSSSVLAVPSGIPDVGEIILPAANSNQPPVVLISSELSVIAGETRDIPFIASDPDSSLPVQVLVVGLNFVSIVPTPTPVIRLAPGPNDVGTYGLALTVRPAEEWELVP